MLTGRPPTVTVEEPAQLASKVVMNTAAIRRFMTQDPAEKY
jgi:hypothetical protein